MTAKHTPGPWHVRTIDESIGSVDAADGSAVAQAQMRGTLQRSNHQERRANARLIAAAPCLFNAAIDGEGALRAAAAIMETQGHRKTAERFMHYAENLRKATDKATGEGEA